MGFDIYACFDEDYIVINPHETKLIPTGIKVNNKHLGIRYITLENSPIDLTPHWVTEVIIFFYLHTTIDKYLTIFNYQISIKTI